MTQAAYHGARPETARAVCVFLHGRGQTPGDMIGSVLARLDAPGLRYILPAAPEKAWYDAKAVEAMTDETARQLDAALARVDGAVAEAKATGLPVVLAGFSQGACMTAEYIMRGGAVDAAAILTGCRVGAASDGLPQAALGALPVYASCGDADSWIPLWAFRALLGELSDAGARLRAEVFPGRAHEVSDTECAELSALLSSAAAGRPALEGAA